MKKKLLAVALAAGFFAGAAQADMLWTGEFTNWGDAFTSEWFKVDSDGVANGVTLSTDSAYSLNPVSPPYFGGENFDPVLLVWDAEGFLVGFSNDVHPINNLNAEIKFDSGVLTEGDIYQFTILGDPNTPTNGFVIGETRFEDGFKYTTGNISGENFNPGGSSPNWRVTATGVTAVPEPETWAMLLAGLGVMGAVARRRQG